MSRARDEQGFMLIELAVAAAVSLIIFGVTLSVVVVMARGANGSERQNDAQQTARQTLDRMARQLRNLASPTSLKTPDNTLPRAIERDQPDDVIFKDVDQVQPAGSANKPNVRRVRYCLDNSTPSDGKLYMELQTWTTAVAPAAPTSTACPGAGWPTRTVVASHLTNGVGDRGVFAYSGNGGAVTGADSDSLADISRITATLYVDFDVTQRPPETQLVTSLFLRNQNREPVATLNAQVLNSTTRTIQLNGSASQDPESQPLTYQWFMDGVPMVETGVLIQYNVPPGRHTFQLKVFDPAGLEGDSSTYTPFSS